MSQALDEEIRKTIEEVLHSPHNLAMPAELQHQALAASRAFDASDQDKSGNLSLEEIGKLCEIMGLPVLEDEEGFFDKLDTDNSGCLEKMEFINWWIKRVSKLPGSHGQQEVIARNTFKRFDKDKSGTMIMSEFKDLVEALGADFTPDELLQAIRELDTDGSGTVSQEEFVTWWVDRTAAIRKGGGLIAIKLKKLANKAARMFYTDIHTASWKGDLDLLKMFLDAEPALKDSEDSSEFGENWTPLHYACYQGHEDIVSELIDRRAVIDRVNEHGFTPLFYAAQREHVNICQLLLHAGANPTIRGTNPDYPDFTLCPADHILECNELYELFCTHKDCFAPNQPSIDTTDISLSMSGMLTIICNYKSKLSKLPIRKWNLKWSSNGISNLIDDTVINNISFDDDKGLKLNYQFTDTISFEKCLKAARNSELMVSFSLTNAMGSSPWSDECSVSLK